MDQSEKNGFVCFSFQKHAREERFALLQSRRHLHSQFSRNQGAKPSFCPCKLCVIAFPYQSHVLLPLVRVLPHVLREVDLWDLHVRVGRPDDELFVLGRDLGLAMVGRVGRRRISQDGEGRKGGSGSQGIEGQEP